MSMNGNFAHSILCSPVTRVDRGWYSSMVGAWEYFFAAWSCPSAPARVPLSSKAEMGAQTARAKIKVRWNFMRFPRLPVLGLTFPQEVSRLLELRWEAVRADLSSMPCAMPDWGVCGKATCRRFDWRDGREPP